MADLVHITDHAERAVARLLEQFRTGASVPALVRVLAAQVQELEDVLWEVLSSCGVAGGVGAQLDVLGRLVGQPREGRSDDTYRIWLRAKTRLNLGSGRPEDLLSLFSAIMDGSTALRLEEQFPAGLVLRVDPGAILDPVAAAAILDRAKVGGVKAILEAATTIDTTSFAFDDNGAGFGDATNAAVGGTFATAL